MGGAVAGQWCCVIHLTLAASGQLLGSRLCEVMHRLSSLSVVVIHVVHIGQDTSYTPKCTQFLFINCASVKRGNLNTLSCAWVFIQGTGDACTSPLCLEDGNC